MNENKNQYNISVIFKNGLKEEYTTDFVDKQILVNEFDKNKCFIFNNSDNMMTYIYMPEVISISINKIYNITDEDILNAIDESRGDIKQ